MLGDMLPHFIVILRGHLKVVLPRAPEDPDSSSARAPEDPDSSSVGQGGTDDSTGGSVEQPRQSKLRSLKVVAGTLM